MTNDRASDTPRTDEMAEIAYNACNTPGEVVLAWFARELERENAGLRAAMEVVRDTAIAMKDAYRLNPKSVLFAEAPERLRALACKALAGEAGKNEDQQPT